jgi:hypothetical protein
MALLTRMFRTVAVTGRTDTVNAWFADRQSGRWVEQKVQGAFPNLPPHSRSAPPAAETRSPADPAETLRDLNDLHERGVLSDAEFEALSAPLRT